MIYRICRKCKLTWNVSNKLHHNKKYLCPRCEGTPWLGTRAGRVAQEQKKAALGTAIPMSGKEKTAIISIAQIGK